MTFSEPNNNNHASSASSAAAALPPPFAASSSSSSYTPQPVNQSYVPASVPEQPAAERTVQVVAPADLQGGYQFHVDAAPADDGGASSNNSKSLLVQVPPGGVSAGQRFHAIVINDQARQQSSSNDDGHAIPVGHWRDGLCACCGTPSLCCQAQCCLTTFCQLCALGQVQVRNQLDWRGRPLHGKKLAWNAFQIMWTVTAVYWFVSTTLGLVITICDQDNDSSEENDEQDSSSTYNGTAQIDDNDPGFVIALTWTRSLLGLGIFIFTWLMVTRTRSYIRNKYGIPPTCCGASYCDDICCGCWCTVCTICQMARHTANYDRYPATCCTENGLLPSARPSVV